MNEIDSVIAQLERQQGAIERALAALREISSNGGTIAPVAAPASKASNRGRLTPAGRKRIAEAAKKRWAAKRAADAASPKANATAAKPAKGGITPEGRQRLAEAMRKRWAAKRATQSGQKTRSAKKSR